MTCSFRKFFITSFALGALQIPVPALANPTSKLPDCSDSTKFEPNAWLVLVNENDSSGRNDLLGAMRALSTGGFSVVYMIPADPAVIVNAKFDPNYYGDSDSSLAARDAALSRLAEARGVRIECNGIAIPFPGITIRN